MPSSTPAAPRRQVADGASTPRAPRPSPGRRPPRPPAPSRRPRHRRALVTAARALQAVDELVAGDDANVAEERLGVAEPAGARVGDQRQHDLLTEVVPFVAEVVGPELRQEAGDQAVHLGEGEAIAREQAVEDRDPVLPRRAAIRASVASRVIRFPASRRPSRRQTRQASRPTRLTGKDGTSMTTIHDRTRADAPAPRHDTRAAPRLSLATRPRRRSPTTPPPAAAGSGALDARRADGTAARRLPARAHRRRRRGLGLRRPRRRDADLREPLHRAGRGHLHVPALRPRRRRRHDDADRRPRDPRRDPAPRGRAPDLRGRARRRARSRACSTRSGRTSSRSRSPT